MFHFITANLLCLLFPFVFSAFSFLLALGFKLANILKSSFNSVFPSSCCPVSSFSPLFQKQYLYCHLCFATTFSPEIFVRFCPMISLKLSSQRSSLTKSKYPNPKAFSLFSFCTSAILDNVDFFFLETLCNLFILLVCCLSLCLFNSYLFSTFYESGTFQVLGIWQ